MTDITRTNIQHLAALSSLKLDDAEVDSLRSDIERIIGYIDQLSELNTDSVEPTYQVTGKQNVWREDIVEQSVSAQTLVGLAHSSSGGSVKVPKVL